MTTIMSGESYSGYLPCYSNYGGTIGMILVQTHRIRALIWLNWASARQQPLLCFRWFSVLHLLGQNLPLPPLIVRKLRGYLLMPPPTHVF